MKYEYKVRDFANLRLLELERDINAYAAQGYRLVTLKDTSVWGWVAVFERPSAEERNATCSR